MERATVKKQHMLSYEIIYSDEERINPLLLLKDIPLVAALEQVAYLLFYLQNVDKDDKKFHSSNLLSWMMKMGGTDQLNTLRFVTTNPTFNHPDFILTDRRSCLRLLQIILASSKSQNKELSKSDWGNLFKSLLTCNKVELDKQKVIFDWDGVGTIEDFADKILPIKIRNIEFDRRKDYKVQLMKIYYFFEFCTSDNYYKPYYEHFLNFHKLKSYDEYIWNVLHPFLLMMSNSEITCKIKLDEKNIIARNFLNQFIINDQKIIIDDDYQILRRFPIFKNDTDTYTFLCVDFFIDKLYQGFLFDFISILNKFGIHDLNFPRLKNDLGNRFSELYPFYITMEKSFKLYGDCRKTGAELKDLLKEGEPDYFIRNKNEIFLFEFKDATLPTSAKYSGDVSIIKKILSERFVITTQNRNTPQNKAVNQLRNSISDILRSKYQRKSVDTFDSNSVIIYPILVFTDVSMEAEGVRYFLKEILNDLLENSSLPKNRIKELVLIHLDTLILFQDLFNQDQINLSDCITSYLTYVSHGDPVNRVFSFGEYFKYYIAEKGYNIQTVPEEFNNILKSFITKTSI